MNNLYEWFFDDITWCGNECYYTECERNMANRLQKTGLFSMSMLKDTEMCPLTSKVSREAQNMGVAKEENNEL